ncbi:hypothetical protein ROZALSC1DRAFT_30187 [Rozella allomycis CSF55]|uniref:Vacuolar protein sorting-associated protein 29 n=1 Tax=Rozella allomycis (strain CSF55) TaxID=988480 RepID=A0A4P9YFP8_ROZAC|nr:hypothetical protein ROZALSC1DRAFT_30187 [Rozella allomycis CSF55]
MPGKIHAILCTGNLNHSNVKEYLKSLCSTFYLVKGEYDNIGLTNSYQLTPFSDHLESLRIKKIQMDVDIFVHGNAPLTIHESEDAISPGSVTGCNTTVPSFALLEIQKARPVVLYEYRLVGGELDVKKNELKLSLK